MQNMKRLLVVLGPDLDEICASPPSPLVERALGVARALDMSVELFHVSQEVESNPTLLAPDSERQRARRRTADQAATRLSELALQLSGEGVTVTTEARWDAPRSDAILRKIHSSQPDLVMKAGGDHGYVLGISTNTDWDLVRQSPVHLWLVKNADRPLKRLITAVGQVDGEENLLAGDDNEIYQLSATVAQALGAENHPVHAFQSPVGFNTFSMYAPEISGMTQAVPQTEALMTLRRRAAREHGEAVEAFADSFEIEPAQVRIVEGHPGDVLPQIADSLDAGLIVMGARSLSRWERVFESVSAEPVLAETPCDILFVKQPEGLEKPEADRQPAVGRPTLDLQDAFADPSAAFGSPMAVADNDAISVPIRLRILQAWEHDVKAKLVEEDEGGPVRPLDTRLLQDIGAARARLQQSAAA